jgi:protein gp37
MSEGYWKQPVSWNRSAESQGKKLKVFCSSMADVFESHPDVASERLKLWELIEATPYLIWQLLTKRPHNILAMVPKRWKSCFPSNVWAMTTTEDQQWFDVRAKQLKKVPATVLGFSCEPLLGEIKLGKVLDGIEPERLWMIAGGESSNSPLKCRPTQHSWFVGLRDQCKQRGIPFFFKQWGNRHEDGVYTGEKSYRLLDGKEWSQFPP